MSWPGLSLPASVPEPEPEPFNYKVALKQWHTEHYGFCSCDLNGPYCAVSVEAVITAAIDELTNAIFHTVDYVGIGTLRPYDSWSWLNALKKYAPQLLESMLRPSLGGLKIGHHC